MNIFGRPKPKAAPKVDLESISKTTSSLRQTLSTLEKRQELLQKKINQQMDEARKLSAAKNKKGALFCLKRKKMYEKEIEKIDGARINIESQVMALESSISNVEIVNSMKTGKNTLSAIHQTLSVEETDTLMDDINEEMAAADEISSAISQPIGGASMMDDEDLMGELDALEGMMMEESMLTAPTVTTKAKVSTPTVPVSSLELPAVPTGVPLGKIEEDPDLAELKALEAEFA